MTFAIVAGHDPQALHGSAGNSVPAGVREQFSSQTIAIAWQNSGDERHFLCARSAERLLLVFGEVDVDRDDWEQLGRLIRTDAHIESVVERCRASATAARGSFALVVVDAVADQAIVLGDTAGVRPLYWTTAYGGPVIASTRREVERVCRARTDEVAVVERGAFGAPLGERTLSVDVKRSLGGQELLLMGSTLRTSLRPSGRRSAGNAVSMEEAAAVLADRFASAVQLRLRGRSGEHSTLSGGLDSRTIVWHLLQQSAAPRCITLKGRHHLDGVLAGQFAAAHGIPLDFHSFQYSRRNLWGMRIRIALDGTAPAATTPAQRTVWSGDGGSVGAGGVYLDAALHGTLTRGSADEAAEAMYRKQGVTVPGLFFTASERRRIRDGILGDLSATIVRARTSGIDTSFAYLLAEDQRRHLDDHHEFLDAHRIEFLLPFFDREVLDLTTSVPIAWIAGHTLYMHWLNRHCAGALTTPWQFYPGHVPCPLPMPDVRSQWDGARRDSIARMDRHFARRGLQQWLRSGASGRTVPLRTALLMSLGATYVPWSRTRSVLNLASDLAWPDEWGGCEVESGTE